MGRDKFWENGIQFQCQGSGNCCVSRGGYGYVYMTLEDRRRMANHLKMKTKSFTAQYCDQEDGIWKLKESPNSDCTFLKDKRCSVYEGRPTQCRTWPFWPEILNAKTWSGEVAAGCPGVGRGRVWTKQEIELQIKEQIESENQYGS